MFRQMLQLFRGTDPLRSILEMFASMLDDGEWMYGQVLDIYSGAATPQERETELFARDRKINATEREVRRRLVEYLTITAKPDVASCLILMSVSKDAERVGDYIKNMYDVSVATGATVNHLARTRQRCSGTPEPWSSALRKDAPGLSHLRRRPRRLRARGRTEPICRRRSPRVACGGERKPASQIRGGPRSLCPPPQANRPAPRQHRHRGRSARRLDELRR